MSNPGQKWRVQSDDDGFDEIAVGSPAWLHVERMDFRSWWFRVGEHAGFVTIKRSGKVRVVLTEGPHAEKAPAARPSRKEGGG